MGIDADLVNLVFVYSLILLTICFVVFLIFFIPVLVQITRTLEAIETIAALVKDYSLSVKEKLDDAGELLAKVKGLTLNLTSSLLDTVLTILKKKS
jgi:uncharacterized protein YoxC